MGVNGSRGCPMGSTGRVRISSNSTGNRTVHRHRWSGGNGAEGRPWFTRGRRDHGQRSGRCRSLGSVLPTAQLCDRHLRRAGGSAWAERGRLRGPGPTGRFLGGALAEPPSQRPLRPRSADRHAACSPHIQAIGNVAASIVAGSSASPPQRCRCPAGSVGSRFTPGRWSMWPVGVWWRCAATPVQRHAEGVLPVHRASRRMRAERASFTHL